MQHPDEGTIHAWLDGALSPEESASLEAHAASCAECSGAIAEARGLVAASSRIVSALDIVPAGVIPTRKAAARPWYASTQLRAAAAVIFVAGASFILVRDKEMESLSDVAQRVMIEQKSAPAVQADEDAASLKQAPPPATEPAQDAVANRSVGSDEPKQKVEASTRVSETAGAAREAAQTMADAAAAPPPVQAPAAMIAAAPPGAEIRDTPALATATAAAAPVVVTGLATTAQKVSSDLRILDVDSSATSRITRYRIASGAELTLTEAEIEFTGRGVTARERRFEAARPSGPVPAPAVVEPQASPAEAARVQVVASLPVTTITWIDPVTQRVYTLAGRVSKETLEEVKAQIQNEKR